MFLSDLSLPLIMNIFTIFWSCSRLIKLSASNMHVLYFLEGRFVVNINNVPTLIDYFERSWPPLNFCFVLVLIRKPSFLFDTWCRTQWSVHRWNHTRPCVLDPEFVALINVQENIQLTFFLFFKLLQFTRIL